MSAVYPDNFEQKTEFTKIRHRLKEFCLSASTRQKIDEIFFSSDPEIIEEWLSLTAEFKHILQYKDYFPSGNYLDIRPALLRTKSLDNYLNNKELLDIIRSFSTIKSIVGFFSEDEENLYPFLRKKSASVRLYPFVNQRIKQVIDAYGNIKDGASPDLRKIRNTLESKKSSVSGSIRKIIRREIQAGHLAQEAELTVREGKLLIPVDTSNKRKINGIIYGESASGKTTFIEPMEVVRLNNEIKEWEFREKSEIKKILKELTSDLRPYYEDMLLACDFLIEIDFIRSKALFALETESEKPSLLPRPCVEFLSARHPLLFLSFQKSGKKVIPIDFRLNDENRILIISGPNAGGKSVSLKTVALLQYMLQCGLLIPVKDVSATGIFEKIFIDIGDEQSIENDLSTYSSHLQNMKFFTENADSETLLLIDEFGTGTEPMLGGAIAEAVLENLMETKSKGIITSHYTNLKHFADTHPGVQNAAMRYDSENMQPLYVMEVGKPGSSFAFEMAEKTGLKKSILDCAKSKMDSKQIDFEQALKQLQSEKRKIKQSKRKARLTEIKLQEKLEHYETMLQKLLSEKKHILSEARLQADEMVQATNRKIENTISEIRKENAEKEKTKTLRRELIDYIAEQKKLQDLDEDKITRKISRLQEKKNRKKKDKKNNRRDYPVREIQIGDFVKVQGMREIGKVIDFRKNKATVICNQIQLTLDKEKLEIVSGKIPAQKTQVKIIRNSDSPANFTPGSTVDLRGKRAEEALQIVTKYIDESIACEHKNLRFLHGTGNGILRKIIRDYLQVHPLVKYFQDEHVEAGGSGITLVELDV